MRVALLIPGIVRSVYDECFKSINKYFIKPFTPDIFISTWSNEYVDDMIRIYKPTLCRVEDYDSTCVKMRINQFLYTLEDKGCYILENTIKSSYPMYYKLYDTNQLKKDYEKIKDFKYDLVIRIRFDLSFDYFFTVMDPSIPKIFGMNQEEIEDSLNNDVIYLRKDPYQSLGSPREFNEWIFDHFSFGQSHMMDIYCDAFLNLEKMISSGLPDIDVNEIVLLNHLKQNNVTLKQTKTVYAVYR